MRDKISKEKQFAFNRGHNVGDLGQQLFQRGIDISEKTKNSKAEFELAQQLIKKNVHTIYEATFIFNGVLIMEDITPSCGPGSL